jgi:hypothetical protein
MLGDVLCATDSRSVSYATTCILSMSEMVLPHVAIYQQFFAMYTQATDKLVAGPAAQPALSLFTSGLRKNMNRDIKL